MNKIQRINKYIKNNKLNALLPQNLGDEVFNVLLREAQELSPEKEDNSAEALLLVIFALKSKKYTKMINEFELHFTGEELMNNIYLYCGLLKMEDTRRANLIHIPEDFLPTLENIFDVDRDIYVEEIDI